MTKPRWWGVGQGQDRHKDNLTSTFSDLEKFSVFQNSTLVAVGSRDRYLNVLDTDKLVPGDPSVTNKASVLSIMDAHSVSIEGKRSRGVNYPRTTARLSFTPVLGQQAGCDLASLMVPKIWLRHFVSTNVVCRIHRPGVYNTDAHVTVFQGWIWCACSQDSILATGSWDRCVRFWDMAANGQAVRRVKYVSARAQRFLIRPSNHQLNCQI